MSKPAPRPRRRSAQSIPDLFPIRTLSKLTGVNPVTLRAWERRHGLFKPRRTPKGHRLYSRADVELVEQILALTARGVPVGQVQEVLARAPGAAERGGADEPWEQARGRMLDAVTRFDEDALEQVYEHSLGLHPVDVVSQRLIVPLLVELGRRWETAEGSVAEEHFFGAYLRNKLGARFHHRARATRGPRLLTACWPGEMHEVGLLLFALAASDAGFRVILLGANMPLEDLPHAVQRSGADAVVLSGTGKPSTETLNRGLPALVRALRVPVFCGGLTAARSHEQIVLAGALPLGEVLADGLARISERLAQRR
jgi:DNA-binding transcriptional MerR regulator/methylmalonyl-CoA mutase cobalamin-binding subunit